MPQGEADPAQVGESLAHELVHVCASALWLRLFRQLEQEEGLYSTGRGVAEVLPLHSQGGVALVILGVLGWWGLFSQDHRFSQAALSIGHHVGGWRCVPLGPKGSAFMAGIHGQGCCRLLSKLKTGILHGCGLGTAGQPLERWRLTVTPATRDCSDFCE